MLAFCVVSAEAAIAIKYPSICTLDLCYYNQQELQVCIFGGFYMGANCLCRPFRAWFILGTSNLGLVCKDGKRKP